MIVCGSIKQPTLLDKHKRFQPNFVSKAKDNLNYYEQNYKLQEKNKNCFPIKHFIKKIRKFKNQNHRQLVNYTAKCEVTNIPQKVQQNI